MTSAEALDQIRLLFAAAQASVDGMEKLGHLRQIVAVIQQQPIRVVAPGPYGGPGFLVAPGRSSLSMVVVRTDAGRDVWCFLDELTVIGEEAA